MYDRRICLFALWVFVGLAIVTFLMQEFEIAAIRKQCNIPTKVSLNEAQEESDVLPGPYNLLEDALLHSNAMDRPTKICTLDFMNNNRLQQDHPCVINYIRHHYLNSLPEESTHLKLDYPEVDDPSDGQPVKILNILSNKTKGFFVECGALDGENLSNTLYMERFFKWTGILIEADPDSFSNLLSRKRQAWSLPVCLSVRPYPTQVTFRVNYALGQIIGIGLPEKNLTGKTSSRGRDITVQCFPLYSILLAVGRIQVDFLSLDIEGHELLVLQTIPFNNVEIRTLSVEWTGGEISNMGKEPIRSFMEQQGYETVLPVDTSDLYFSLKK